MSEYTNITEDYVKRTLENYINFKNDVKYSFTAGISTLQAISIAIVDEKKSNKVPEVKTLFYKIIHHDDYKKLENISFFHSSDTDFECFKNIRDGISHFVENYQYINKGKDLNKFRFTCNNMNSQSIVADIEEKELDDFLKIIYEIVSK